MYQILVKLFKVSLITPPNPVTAIATNHNLLHCRKKSASRPREKEKLFLFVTMWILNLNKGLAARWRHICLRIRSKFEFF